ncbi:MAG: DeoR/GlpR transcriptional regulator [Chloroflexi bacterium]|uniref:DeoR/GlpR family DNA-binding transcription regulator n=1 Tax=Candidatus Flexifilum breve TaxID=3140694 RepID=UPI003136664A|nr:DeoR/GlpR transcriptional regulator [Chloroflexota bacterium]
MAVFIRIMNQRREQIVNILSERERVTVNELSEMLSVSSVTVRGDLNFLAEEGRIVRVHGGAALAKPSLRQEMTFAARQRRHAAEKHALAKLAATLVKQTDSILLDSSTTALAVGQAIKDAPNITNLTVITTGLWTAVAIMDSPNIHHDRGRGKPRQHVWVCQRAYHPRDVSEVSHQPGVYRRAGNHARKRAERQ